MNKFIFKSPRRLVKNSYNIPELDLILKQNRELRQDLVDVKLMLNRLLIDKHLQTQVDDYFNSPPTPPPTQGLDYPGDSEPDVDTRDLD